MVTSWSFGARFPDAGPNWLKSKLSKTAKAISVRWPPVPAGLGVAQAREASSLGVVRLEALLGGLGAVPVIAWGSIGWGISSGHCPNGTNSHTRRSLRKNHYVVVGFTFVHTLAGSSWDAHTA